MHWLRFHPYQHRDEIPIQYLINIPHVLHELCWARAFGVTSAKRASASDNERMNRRIVLKGLAASILVACDSDRGQASVLEEVTKELRTLEENAGGRLGAYIFDMQTDTGFGYRDGERFAHCSSFKMSLAAMVLKMSEDGQIDLSERLHWSTTDMLHVSPVTKANLETGLTVEQLAHATLVTSDNTAANVLLKRFGGPARLTAFWASLGDSVSRLDRYEPALNETPPGTELDTTTPKAMAHTTAALVHGSALSITNRAKLQAWMTEVQTGTQRIRAGFPRDWRSGDKTGTGIGAAKHTYVDIAFGIPPGRAPIIVTAYFEPEKLVEPMDPIAVGVLADVGRLAALSAKVSSNQLPRLSRPLTYVLE